MRILFVDRDEGHARQLYGQILSYKGVPWDLLHCTKLVEAVSWLERGHFDLVLLCVYQRDRVADAYTKFINQNGEIPTVVLSDSSCDADHAKFIRLGANDCLQMQSANGAFVMRRIRMALSRFHSKVALEHAVPASYLIPALAVTSNGLQEDTAGDAFSEPKHETPDRELTLVVDDTSSARLFDFKSNLKNQYRLVSSLSQAAEILATPAHGVSAIVTEQSVIEREGYHYEKKVRERFAGVPLVVVMVDRTDIAAVSFIDQGVDDCELGESTNQLAVERSLSLARARTAFRVSQIVRVDDKSVSDRRLESRDGGDRRRSARYLCQKPLLAIPILPNGAPDKTQMCEAITTDLSAGGIGLQLPSDSILPSKNWIIGVTGQQGDSAYSLHFANVVVRNVSYLENGVRLGTSFQHPTDDLLKPSNLQPRLDLSTGLLRPELPTAVLDEWCEAGVMRRVLMHRVHSCPECSGILAVGAGCRECGSPRYQFQRLIHHFACAYFGHEEEFESSDGLTCPKCRTRGLVAGADFELTQSQYQCTDCGYEGNELEQVCNCLHCQLRLPLRMAREQRVYGYDVERLDVLAYLSSAT